MSTVFKSQLSTKCQWARDKRKSHSGLFFKPLDLAAVVDSHTGEWSMFLIDFTFFFNFHFVQTSNRYLHCGIAVNL